MKIKELGERKLVNTFLSSLKLPDGVFPLFDDTQAFTLGHQLISFKIDTFVFSTDRPKALAAYDVGWKAITAVASDMAAKGASPYLFMCSLSLPGDTEEDDAINLENGMNDAASEYGGHLIGGDTGEAQDGVVAISGIGLHPNNIYTPRTARVKIENGDVVAVTGNFGYTSLGLNYMLGKIHLDDPMLSKALEAFRRPKARVKSGLALSNLGAKSSMDSSDGLALTLSELARLNGLDVEIEEMPIDDDLENFFEANHIDPISYVFYGGEEYELIGIFPAAVKPKLNDFGFRAIGFTNEGTGVIKYKDTIIANKGYEHFK